VYCDICSATTEPCCSACSSTTKIPGGVFVDTVRSCGSASWESTSGLGSESGGASKSAKSAMPAEHGG